MKTLKQLIDDPKSRKPDGSMTDEAYAQYKATTAAHPDGFVPDDELDATPVSLPRFLVQHSWSYPTSHNAQKFGMAKSGCWTVSLVTFNREGEQNPPEAVAAFATESEAQAYKHVVARQIATVV